MMTFRKLALIFSLLLSSSVFADPYYSGIKNGEVIASEGKLLTKVILNKQGFSKSRNRKSIAELHGLKNLQRYPFSRLQWEEQYSVNDQEIFVSSFFRLTKQSSTITGFKFEKEWTDTNNYYYLFSAPVNGLEDIVISTERIISTVRKAISNRPTKLDYLAVLDISFRHPQLFDRSSLQSFLNDKFNKKYGNNLLMVLLGIEGAIESNLAWNGTEADLANLDPDNLLILLSENPFNHLIIYRVAVLLDAGGYHSLALSLLESTLKQHSQAGVYEPLVNLANRLALESN